MNAFDAGDFKGKTLPAPAGVMALELEFLEDVTSTPKQHLMPLLCMLVRHLPDCATDFRFVDANGEYAAAVIFPTGEVLNPFDMAFYEDLSTYIRFARPVEARRRQVEAEEDAKRAAARMTLLERAWRPYQGDEQP